MFFYNRKRSRKDDNTYGLTVEIVPGSGSAYHDSTRIPVVALFNASSEHSWISLCFAKQLGIDVSSSISPGCHTQSVKLDWKCDQLGKFTQRTVFMIAPAGNFSVLFSELDNENQTASQPSLFQQGVKRGVLESLVENGQILQVVPAPLEQKTVALSLEQLNEQLAQDSEGHSNYHALRDANVCRTRYNTSPCCGLGSGNESLRDMESGRSTRSKHHNDYLVEDLTLDEESETISPSKRAKVSRHSSPRARKHTHRHQETRRILRSSRTSSRSSSGSSMSISVEDLPPLFKSRPRSEGWDTVVISSQESEGGYWSWDKEKKEYFHVDEETGERYWYDGPP